MRIFFLTLMLCGILVSGFGISYETVSAGIVPCGMDLDGKNGVDASEMCTLCHLFTGINNIIQWGLRVMAVIAIVMIVVAGIFYIVSIGNDGMMTTAKGILKNVLIGVFVMLLAWVIVNTIINILGVNYKGEGSTWYAPEFVCNVNAGAVSETGASNVNNPGGGGAPTSP